MRLSFVSLGLVLALCPALAVAAAPQQVPLPDGLTPGAFATAGSHLVFRGAHESEPDALWQSDGTTATELLGPDGDELEDPALLGSLDERVYFTARAAGATSVYRTDGVLAERLAEGPATRGFAATGRLFFTTEADAGAEDLWTTDGTAAGTTRTGVQLPSYAPAIGLGPDLLFAGPGAQAETLWRSDGTTAGTHALLDADAGAGAEPGGFAVVGSSATFFSFGADRTLWRTDGSTAGTSVITRWPADAQLRGAYGFDRHLYFRLHTGGTWALWGSDGTAAGTAALGLLDAAGVDAPILGAGNKVFFVAGPVDNAALWVTDGSPAGTTTVHAGAPSTLTTVGNRVYYPLDATRLGGSDGTPAGTGELTLPVEAGALDGAGGIFTAAGNILYFTTTDSSTMLWALPFGVTSPPDAGAADDAGADAGTTVAAPAATDDDGGCSCNASSIPKWLGLLLLGVFSQRTKHKPSTTPRAFPQ